MVNSPPIIHQVYVTHRLRENADAVWDLLSRQGAEVFVSGSAQKMPSDVALALEDVAVAAGGLSKDGARSFIRQMELKGKYHVEAW